MSSLGVSTTVEQDDRHSSLIFRVMTKRRLAGMTWQIRRTELWVDENGFTAQGDLGGYKPGSLHLNWSRVCELHYAPARPGDLGGLYAREGAQCSRCIAPRLTETQAAQVLATLIRRFPALAHTVEVDLAVTINASVLSSPVPTSSDLLPGRPTLHARSFSHVLSPVLQSMIGRKHESARRIY